MKYLSLDFSRNFPIINRVNKINYDKNFIDILSKLEAKPTLLLHSCCGPCSTLCIERLIPYFDLTVLFYNPNIYDKTEYEKRKNEQIKYINLLKKQEKYVNFIEIQYNYDEFLQIAHNLENEAEGGKRCFECYKLRLKKTFEYANSHNFDYFCSTLSVSPYKNAQWLNEIGISLNNEKTKWLESDFKKREGYKISRRLARENNLYEQDFCGCEFSKNQIICKKNN